MENFILKSHATFRIVSKPVHCTEQCDWMNLEQQSLVIWSHCSNQIFRLRRNLCNAYNGRRVWCKNTFLKKYFFCKFYTHEVKDMHTYRLAHTICKILFSFLNKSIIRFCFFIKLNKQTILVAHDSHQVNELWWNIFLFKYDAG